jgi:hypothetical protein
MDDDREIGKGGTTVMNGHVYRSRRLNSWIGIAIASGLMISSGLIAGVQGVQADESSFPAGMASYPSGKITSIYERTFQIDGRTVKIGRAHV